MTSEIAVKANMNTNVNGEPELSDDESEVVPLGFQSATVCLEQVEAEYIKDQIRTETTNARG